MQYHRTVTPTLLTGRGRSPARGRHALLPAILLGALGMVMAAARAQDPGTAGPPVAVPPVTAAVGNWSAWTPVAGPTFVAPSLAFNPAAGSVEVVTVGLDLMVMHSHMSGGSAAPLSTGQQSFLPTVVLVDASGTLHLLVTGADAAVTHSQMQNNAWRAPMPTGVTSFLPPAAAVNVTGNTLEMVTVGVDGGLRHSRLVGGAWSSPAPMNAVTFLPPTLVSNPGGGVDLAIVGLDRQVYHTHSAGNQWVGFQPTGVFTEMSPALAVSSDGVVHLVATGLDRGIVHSRFVNNEWSAPVPIGVQSPLSPAMVFSSEDNSLEVLARGNDRTVQHSRFIGGTWVAPTSLGITTDVRPALAVEGNGGLDAAIAATDGRVYLSHYTGSSQSAVGAAAPPSFSRDILRIFDNNGAKTCAQSGCHSGSHPQGGQDLEKDKAYANIVNVASSEQPKLKRVLPGDADHSYLFQKVSTGAMPRSGGPLTPADIDLIRQWINAGAPNN